MDIIYIYIYHLPVWREITTKSLGWSVAPVSFHGNATSAHPHGLRHNHRDVVHFLVSSCFIHWDADEPLIASEVLQ